MPTEPVDLSELEKSLSEGVYKVKSQKLVSRFIGPFPLLHGGQPSGGSVVDGSESNHQPLLLLLLFTMLFNLNSLIFTYSLSGLVCLCQTDLLYVTAWFTSKT